MHSLMLRLKLCVARTFRTVLSASRHTLTHCSPTSCKGEARCCATLLLCIAALQRDSRTCARSCLAAQPASHGADASASPLARAALRQLAPKMPGYTSTTSRLCRLVVPHKSHGKEAGCAAAVVSCAAGRPVASCCCLGLCEVDGLGKQGRAAGERPRRCMAASSSASVASPLRHATGASSPPAVRWAGAEGRAAAGVARCRKRPRACRPRPATRLSHTHGAVPGARTARTASRRAVEPSRQAPAASSTAACLTAYPSSSEPSGLQG